MTCTCKFQNRQVNLHLREESTRREEALEREVWIHMKRASHVFPGEIDTMEIHDSSKFDGFLRKKRLSTERFPGLWTGIGGPFGWLALIDMLMKKLAVNFIPDTSLIRGKLLWFQIEGFGSSGKLCWSHLMKLLQHSTAAWCGFQRCYWVASPCLTEPLRTCYIARLDPHFYPIHPICLGL